MTCHVAVSSADFAVFFADSQATSAYEQSESHGAQKIFAGPDFLLGFAGSGLIGNLVFSKLRAAVDAGTVKAAQLEPFIKSVLQNEVRQPRWGDVGFICATPSSDGKWVQTYDPGELVNFSPRLNFATIGSGSTFVYRTVGIANEAGIGPQWQCIATGLAAAKQLIDAADESLTVDSTHLLGICWNSRAYILGDIAIEPRFARDNIKSRWKEVAKAFDEIIAILKAMVEETKQAQRSAHPTCLGQIAPTDTARITAASNSVAKDIVRLTQRVKDFITWHDTVAPP